MSRRKENIRKACDEIDEFVDALETQIKNGNLQLALFTLSGIKPRTHRIKRTTWRGEKDRHRPELRLACTCKTCLPTKSSNIFDNEKYLNGEMSVNYKPTKPSAKHSYNENNVCLNCGCSKKAIRAMKWSCKEEA